MPESHKHSLESNIWKFAIFLITHKRTFMTIFGVYLLTLPDATPQTLGLITLIGSIAGFIFEVPSGYISDKIGHKNALVLAKVSMLLSTILYLIGNEVVLFIIGAIFLNVGWALGSGTKSAFMHETLTELGRENEYSKVMGKVSSVGFAVPIVFIVTIPFLVSIDFKLPFLVASIIDLVGLVAAMSLTAPTKTKEQIQEIQTSNFRKIMQEGYGLGYFKYAIFAAVMAGAITASSTFKDVYQAFVGVPIIYYGVFWGISRVIVSLLLLTNDKVKKSLSFHKFLGIKMMLASLIIISLGVFSSPVVIVSLFILVSAFNWSFMQTQSHFMLEIIGESSFKATLLSVKALLTTLIIGIIAFLLGALVDKSSYNFGFTVLGLSLASLLLVLYMYITFSKKLKRPKAKPTI